MTVVHVEDIPALGHEEAMDLADADYDRMLSLVDGLEGPDWTQPTDCAGWDVKAMLGHLLGMLELQADPEDRMRQLKLATEEAEQSGRLRLDALTALQVREHAQLSIDEVRAELHVAAPRGLAARRAMPAEFRATPYDPQLPGFSGWTFGYLFDVIHTRDPWLHRIDITRATGHELDLSASHDGRIVADVVAEWSRAHAQPFSLELTGPAGGSFIGQGGGPIMTLDAVEFCRTLSGRTRGTGLLETHVVF
ncbi:MAG: maleylpyruvate isomerase family mycothiol-dependent enzyme [Actinomycetota bacterium]|nr:maleylpyruvate isomerase family mycothiol-dependent enzyme [Actinomycetota bacterium]